MILRQAIYHFFYHLRVFFNLTFKPLLGLIAVGMVTSILLLLSAKTQLAGTLIFVGCIATALWITLIHCYYSAILNWSDTRKEDASVIEFPNKPLK
ncbi:hypothetical protein [Photobacterium lutimaris]|nr:hypothetical protein [Photobacterium lutimaris]TDR74936.1 hypothetical protein DFP78_106267 [Photobacterium lutimaris]